MIVRRTRSDCRLILVGQGPLAPTLRELTSSLDLQDAVDFLDPRDDIREVLAAADVVAAPSLSEGFGLSVVEAMAMARPVVATRVGGLLEIVDDGRSGFLVPPADPSALAAALLRVLNDAVLRRELGERARAVAELRFDIRGTARATERIYDTVLSGGRA
jgi:glycosyltransferase involved in cell wall biosynthesis